jgi:hypothetical protein
VTMRCSPTPRLHHNHGRPPVMPPAFIAEQSRVRAAPAPAVRPVAPQYHYAYQRRAPVALAQRAPAFAAQPVMAPQFVQLQEQVHARAQAQVQARAAVSQAQENYRAYVGGNVPPNPQLQYSPSSPAVSGPAPAFMDERENYAAYVEGRIPAEAASAALPSNYAQPSFVESASYYAPHQFDNQFESAPPAAPRMPKLPPPPVAIF